MAVNIRGNRVVEQGNYAYHFDTVSYPLVPLTKLANAGGIVHSILATGGATGLIQSPLSFSSFTANTPVCYRIDTGYDVSFAIFLYVQNNTTVTLCYSAS